MCRNCGYTVKCKNCNISLTYHSFEKKLKCHYCGYEENVVTICPECHSDKIRYFGTGTQKLEQEIKIKECNNILVTIFPNLKFTLDNAKDNIKEWQKLADQKRRTGWTPNKKSKDK